MNLDMSAPKALRRAALQLHAMAPPDRAWMLASLAPDRRVRLEALLQELRSLGIPADAALLQFGPDAATETASAHPSPTERLQSLSEDEVVWLAAHLEKEPPALTAMLLAHQAWPWRQALVDRLDDATRRCVGAAAQQPRLALAEGVLHEAVVRLLPAKLASPGRAGLPWWSRLRSIHLRRAAAA
jgi:hypothetical protein